METEQFSLCWNNFHNNLRTGFHSLLQDEDLVDVTLAAEGRFIKAHKTVLSICSPYFKELFKANPCKHPIVILQDVKYSALSCLLQFMYQGEVSVSQDEIPTFMRVAEMLKIKGLTENNSSNSSTVSYFRCCVKIILINVFVPSRIQMELLIIVFIEAALICMVILNLNKA